MYEIDSRLFYQEVKSNPAEIETAVNRQETNRSGLKKKLANEKNISISITQNHSFQGGFLQAKCFSNSTNEQKSQKEWGGGILQMRGSSLSSGRDYVYVGVGVGSTWEFYSEFNLTANTKLL